MYLQPSQLEIIREMQMTWEIQLSKKGNGVENSQVIRIPATLPFSHLRLANNMLQAEESR